jgi:hypothetical protein
MLCGSTEPITMQGDFMSLNSIYSSLSSTDPLSQLYSQNSTSSTSSSDSTSGSSSTGSSSSTSVSSQAKLFQQLQQLEQTNPAEFKKVTADIASELQTQGQQEGGSQGQALTNLAAQFQQASQTGSLTPLEHHHHGGGGSAGSASDASSSSTSSASDGTASSTSSAAAAAAAAYQEYSGQSASSQVSAIISQVLNQDLGSSATNTTA